MLESGFYSSITKERALFFLRQIRGLFPSPLKSAVKTKKPFALKRFDYIKGKAKISEASNEDSEVMLSLCERRGIVTFRIVNEDIHA